MAWGEDIEMQMRETRQRRAVEPRDFRTLAPIPEPAPVESRPPVLIAPLPWTARQQFYVASVKPVLDICLTLLLLIPGLPVMAVIALAIRLTTRGPVLYRQERIGLHGQPFTVYKFRTMIPDRRVRNERVPFPDRRRRHKSESDPRVTRVGRFLRRTSLDELPQLFNVLRGEMSLVGPRPELPMLVDRYEPWQHERHLVRPGITGWWQVNGRGDRPMHENTELDIEYVRRVSLWLDLYILCKTAWIVLTRRGAF